MKQRPKGLLYVCRFDGGPRPWRCGACMYGRLRAVVGERCKRCGAIILRTRDDEVIVRWIDRRHRRKSGNGAAAKGANG